MPEPFTYNATIIAVHDGDTVRAEVQLGFYVKLAELDIRLLGINAPELPTEAGKAAQKFLSDLILAQNVIVQTVRVKDHSKQEKYGRWLATIYLTQNDANTMTSVNQMMIEAGHAVKYMV